MMVQGSSGAEMETICVDGKEYYRLRDKERPTQYIEEPSRQIPTAYDVDVVVAGAGIAGLMAAIAAGRQGMKTVLVERFGTLGGNIGPGMVIAGPLTDAENLARQLPGGPVSLPKEFIERIRALAVSPGENYPELANIVTYVGLQMAEEAGVELILSAYAADPIIAGSTVQGLFVEGKSGRMAVRSRIVIDGTGDAAIAERAGAPMIQKVAPDPAYANMVSESRLLPEFSGWNETALAYVIGGMPAEKSDELHGVGVRYKTHGFKGDFQTNSMAQMSWIEKHVRMRVFEHVQSLRRQSGCEQAYLLATASFVGARGGPCIEGEHVLTLQEAYEGTPFADVMFRNIFRRPFVKEGYNPAGFEIPYRMLLPKGLDGLLVTGRGASYIRRGHDGPGTRVRLSMLSLGECTGTAAACALKAGQTPQTLTVGDLQAVLVKAGYDLGGEQRRQELGLL